jgi:hypothetical protein
MPTSTLETRELRPSTETGISQLRTPRLSETHGK